MRISDNLLRVAKLALMGSAAALFLALTVACVAFLGDTKRFVPEVVIVPAPVSVPAVFAPDVNEYGKAWYGFDTIYLNDEAVVFPLSLRIAKQVGNEAVDITIAKRGE